MQEDGCTEDCVWDTHGLAYVHPVQQYVICSSASNATSRTTHAHNSTHRQAQCAPAEVTNAATYQRRNLRNMLAALGAHAQGNLVGWQDWSPSARSDTMRVSLDGLTLHGDVLDYGADPAGQQARYLMRDIFSYTYTHVPYKSTHSQYILTDVVAGPACHQWHSDGV